MQTTGARNTRDWSHIRRESRSFWPKSHPVMFPHLHTDHWSKMKTTVPGYLTSFPTALLKDTVSRSLECNSTLHSTISCLPPLNNSAANDHITFLQQEHCATKSALSPQNVPQYRNQFNERARRGFCYWLVDGKSSSGKYYSMGSHNTYLGLPRV